MHADHRVERTVDEAKGVLRIVLQAIAAGLAAPLPGIEVAAKPSSIERTACDRGRVQGLLVHACRWQPEAMGGVDDVLPAREAQEHPFGLFPVGRLAEFFALEFDHGVDGEHGHGRVDDLRTEGLPDSPDDGMSGGLAGLARELPRGTRQVFGTRLTQGET